MKKKYIFIAIAAMLFFLQQKQKTEKSIVAIVLVETLSTSLKMFYIEKRLLMTKNTKSLTTLKKLMLQSTAILVLSCRYLLLIQH